MKTEELKRRIESLCTHITFEFNGKDCGVDPFTRNDFDMWYGEEKMKAGSIDEVMYTPFFEGHALADIVDKIKNLDI